MSSCKIVKYWLLFFLVFVLFLGFETARALALHGVHVTLACRNLKSANAAAAKIKKELEMAKIVTMTLDLASLRSVKQFAENYKHREW